MKLNELMQGYSPDPSYEGWVTNDDWVIAVDTSATKDGHPDDYTVVQMGIAGFDAQLNPVTQEKQYIRAGQSTQKTGTQRTFSVTGDRYIGDPFQDYAFSHGIKYGTGQKVVVPYVYFNVLNGRGEQGTVSIIDNTDSSGSAGESSSIDISLNKVGAMPEEYAYAPAGTLTPLTVTSVAAAATGETTVTATPTVPSGMSALYQAATTVTLPAYDDVINGAPWTAFISGSDYTATTGDEFAVVYVDTADNKAKYAGKTTVTSAP